VHSNCENQAEDSGRKDDNVLANQEVVLRFGFVIDDIVEIECGYAERAKRHNTWDGEKS